MGLEKEKLVTPIEECNEGFKKWRKLGWIPYCPKQVRKHIPWLKKSWYIPYNYIKWKASGELKFNYHS